MRKRFFPPRDGCYKPLERLRLRYEQAGIIPDKEIITYCVTAHKAKAGVPPALQRTRLLCLSMQVLACGGAAFYANLCGTNCPPRHCFR
jgi:hypothetical protein